MGIESDLEHAEQSPYEQGYERGRDEGFDLGYERGRGDALANLVDVRLLRESNARLIEVCTLLVEGGSAAVRALNAMGAPCPASIALAAEKARAAIAAAKALP